MGGCCSSSNRVEWNDSAGLHHVTEYPVVSQERQPLSSRSGAATVTPTGLLVDTNLDTSIPDTYRHPPAPIPYDASAGNPHASPNNREFSSNKHHPSLQTYNSESVGETKINNGGENVAKESMDLNCKEQISIKLVATDEADPELENSDELKKSSIPFVTPEECPTCLEEYDEENPKMITKCEHHFHLSCILEWMERSDTCPVCDQVMDINFPIDD